jgi:hypothetical protein
MRKVPLAIRVAVQVVVALELQPAGNERASGGQQGIQLGPGASGREEAAHGLGQQLQAVQAAPLLGLREPHVGQLPEHRLRLPAGLQLALVVEQHVQTQR